MNSLSTTQAAYIAGILDGEGCISYTNRGARYKSRRYPQLRVIVVNTSEELILWLREVTGCGKVYTRKATARHKSVYVVEWKANIAIELLKQVLDYMTVKKVRAGVVISLARKVEFALGERGSFGSAGPPEWLLLEKQRTVELMSALNKRGVN